MTEFNFDWDKFYQRALEFAGDFVLAIAILIIGMYLVRRVGKITKKVLSKREYDASLNTFLVSLVVIMMRIMVVITALTTLGLEMTSFIALLGAAGIAIGMAFSGTLGNLAGGVMILLFRPFKTGDYIDAQGESGIVKEIQIFQTILLTFDNKTIYIPNGPLANGNLTNYTKQELRRVDLTANVEYGADSEHVKKTLTRIAENHPLILKDPVPFIGLKSMADSAVVFDFRVWCKVDDYWTIYYECNELIYNTFNKEGISFPFPQLDVHVVQKQ